MKRLVLSLFAVALLALPICAQVGSAQATIPFAFTAGNMTLPAGGYVFHASFPATLVGPDLHFRFLTGWSSDSSVETPKLIFHRYGNQYFLSEIYDGQTSHTLVASRVELELQKTMAAAPRNEFVLLALR